MIYSLQGSIKDTSKETESGIKLHESVCRYGTGSGNMVCPVCVVGGAGLILSKIFGLPDIVVAFVTGMMATSMAFWGNYILTKRWKKIKGQLVAINIISGILCLYSLKLVGFW